ncbi:MAG: hypothetical protein R3F33_16175 [Planctomycetota bacterium]
MLFALAACGSGQSEGRFVPLELEADAPPPSPAPVQFRRYIPGKGSPLWRGEADEWRFTQVPAHARRDATQEVKLKPAFLVQGAGEKSLSVVDELDGNQFNRIEIEATVFELGHAEISLALCRRGEVLAESPALTLWAGDQAPTTLVFEFPELRGWYTLLDEIRIRMGGDALLCTVSGMTLLQTDAEACLPPADPKGQVRYLTLGNETRRGWAISREHPLRTPAASDAGKLHFTLAPLLNWNREVPESELVLRLDSGKQEKTLRSWDVQPFGKNAGWIEILTDQAMGGRDRGRWDFELASSGSAPAFALMGEPSLVQEGRSEQLVLLVTTEGISSPLFSEPEPTDLPLAVRTWLERGVQLPGVMPASHDRHALLTACMTGLHPRDTGVWSSQQVLALNADTLAEAFHAAGYRTLGAVFASDLSHERTGLAQGFDRYLCPSQGQWAARELLAATRSALADCESCPTFVWIHLPGTSSGQGASLSWSSELEVFLTEPRLRSATLAFTSLPGFGERETSVPAGARRLPMVLVGGPSRVNWPDRVRLEAADLGRTLLNLVGRHGTPFPGSDLLAGPWETLDAAPHFALGPEGRYLSLQSGNWLKVVQTGLEPGTGETRHLAQMFDLETDPDLRTDESNRDRAQARRMHVALSTWTGETRPLGWGSLVRTHLGRRAWVHRPAFGGGHGAWLDWLPAGCTCGRCPSALGGE